MILYRSFEEFKESMQQFDSALTEDEIVGMYVDMLDRQCEADSDDRERAESIRDVFQGGTL